MIEYRLSWQSIDSHQADRMERYHGRKVWAKLSDEEWEGLEWQTPTVRIDGERPSDQFNTLKGWAETREQPIRNVKLEQREAPEPDSGWEPAEEVTV